MHKEVICGIYRIINTLDNKYYIGSSINIYKRWSRHIRDLNKNKHHSVKLQRAWNKYGKQRFIFEILETCEPIKDTILLIEQKYLDLHPYYNCLYFSRNSLGYKHTEESLTKMSEVRMGNKNCRYGITLTNEVKSKIKKANDDYYLKKYNGSKSRGIVKKTNITPITAKPVLMIDIINNEVLKEFSSIMEAARFIGDSHFRTGIRKTVYKERKTAYGYKWRFKNDI